MKHSIGVAIILRVLVVPIFLVKPKKSFLQFLFFLFFIVLQRVREKNQFLACEVSRRLSCWKKFSLPRVEARHPGPVSANGYSLILSLRDVFLSV